MYLGEDWSSRRLRKTLTEEYPYLLPKTMTTGKVHADYDYQYIVGEYDLPEGWIELFLQCCKDIKEPLVKAGHLDKFRFLQIKEKWGRMELYCYGATDEVYRIVDKYRFLSQQVCSICGKPAAAITLGYVCPYCSEHAKDVVANTGATTPVDIRTSYVKEHKSPEGITKEIIDCTEEWDRYLNKICCK